MQICPHAHTWTSNFLSACSTWRWAGVFNMWATKKTEKGDSGREKKYIKGLQEKWCLLLENYSHLHIQGTALVLRKVDPTSTHYITNWYCTFTVYTVLSKCVCIEIVWGIKTYILRIKYFLLCTADKAWWWYSLGQSELRDNAGCTGASAKCTITMKIINACCPNHESATDLLKNKHQLAFNCKNQCLKKL